MPLVEDAVATGRAEAAEAEEDEAAWPKQWRGWVAAGAVVDVVDVEVEAGRGCLASVFSSVDVAGRFIDGDVAFDDWEKGEVGW